jgi:replication factor A1
MKIAELQPRTGKVDLDAAVTEISEARSIEKQGFNGRVQDATITDETGSVTLTLWNELVDTIKVGDKVRITNGWVNEFQGKMQLSPGKYGKLEKIE